VVSAREDASVAQEWAACLALSGGDKNQCLDQASGLVVNEATVSAVLMLLAVSLLKHSFSHSISFVLSLLFFFFLLCFEMTADGYPAQWHLAILSPRPLGHGDGMD
jgi:hypothetical protein